MSKKLKGLSKQMATKPERQNERTTLHEVATLAGVSASTVSLVLAGKASHRRISEDTRRRVRKAAEELNYAPNLLTRSLRRGRTHILSFFSTFRHREWNDQYMARLSSAVETAGGTEGYDILVHCNFNRSPLETYQFLNGGLADGLLLFAPRHDDPLLPLLRKSSLPVVILNGRDPLGEYASIADDVAHGMRLVAESLVAYGHRDVAALRGEGGDARDALVRIELLQRYLAESGITIPDRWMLGSSDDAVPVVERLMSDPNPPTAVFCWHDRLAYQVLSACESLGIRVPDQLSVVGYDGLQWPSATKHVAASVQVDLNALAQRGVHLLDLYIKGYEGPPLLEVLPVSFDPGTSLGAAIDTQRSKL
ncbi:MAG TPA: LacI family DNA-binding transcriptional regulator [Fimbriimonas sp.]